MTYMALFFLEVSVYAHEQWTWLYVINPSTSQCIKKPHEYLITKMNVHPFTQLIFSWNAYRPIKGYYTFFIQGKDQATGLWSSWHKMMVWGTNIQRSYLSKADSIAQHIHVRFEAQKGKKMSGFRIKIIAHGTANLEHIESITACCTDYTKFKSEPAYIFNTLPSVRVLGVPRKSQFMIKHPDNHRLCSPTSCAMLVELLSNKACDPLVFARHVYDDGLDAYGSWPFNMAHAFEKSDGTYHYAVMRYNSFNDLYKQLQKGFPVVVSVRGYMQGAPKTYESGHLLIVVGFDQCTQKVICHDPACKRISATLKFYPLASFLSAWETSRRLVYSVRKISFN